MAKNPVHLHKISYLFSQILAEHCNINSFVHFVLQSSWNTLLASALLVRLHLPRPFYICLVSSWCDTTHAVVKAVCRHWVAICSIVWACNGIADSVESLTFCKRHSHLSVGYLAAGFFVSHRYHEEYYGTFCAPNSLWQGKPICGAINYSYRFIWFHFKRPIIPLTL